MPHTQKMFLCLLEFVEFGNADLFSLADKEYQAFRAVKSPLRIVGHQNFSIYSMMSCVPAS